MKEIFNEETYTKRSILFMSVIVIICFLCFYIYNDRGTDDTVNQQLRNVGIQQQQTIRDIQDSIERTEHISNGLQETTRTVESVTNRIKSVIDSTSTVEEILRDSQQRIRDCKSILQEVQETKTDWTCYMADNSVRTCFWTCCEIVILILKS